LCGNKNENGTEKSIPIPQKVHHPFAPEINTACIPSLLIATREWIKFWEYTVNFMAEMSSKARQR
jgi:hypothetical protein